MTQNEVKSMEQTIEELKDEIEGLKVQRDYWKNMHEIAESKIVTLTNNSTQLALRLDKCQKESIRMLERIKKL